MMAVIEVLVLIVLGLLASVGTTAGFVLMMNAVMPEVTLFGGILFIVSAACCVTIGTRIANVIKENRR